MRLTINGETREFDGPISVDAMLAALDLDPRKLAVELNRSILPKSAFGATRLADGDAIEIVQFVGGG